MSSKKLGGCNGSTQEEKGIKPQNSIFLFGELALYDREGNDLAYRLTPKQKQLFVLILLKSLNHTNGINTKTLTAKIWPDLGVYQAKNSRGVAVSRLRNILNEVEGIEIVMEHNKWTMNLSASIYCDYRELIFLMHSDNYSYENIKKMKEILYRGTFLCEMDNEWAEAERIKLSDDFLTRFRIVLNDNLNPENHLQLADCIMILDPLNEQIMKIKVQTSKLMGNHAMARHTYDLFCKEYYGLYGEKYPKDFKDI